MKRITTKVFFYFFILYFILISSILNFYTDIINNYEEMLSSTNSKIIGVKYLKLLNKFTVDIIDMQDKNKITSFVKKDIVEMDNFQNRYPIFKNTELKKYIKSIENINSIDTNSYLDYYDFFDYINNLNYMVGNNTGILFAKEKQHYFLGSLMTHYLPEFIISIGISHNILEEFISTKNISKNKKKIYIEQSKLIYLSEKELINIIVLLKEFPRTKKLSNILDRIRANIDDLKKKKSALIILDGNVDKFKVDLEIIHKVVDLGLELNSEITSTLQNLLKNDKKYFQKKIFTYKFLIIFIILLVTAIFIYFFRIFILNITKDKELEEFNKTLLSTVEQEVKKNREKDKQLMQQSRLAQMGEMISMIAHQWRQPLAAISSTSVSLELKAKLKKLDDETIIQQARKISKYSQHLSSTIDDFRDFFKPEKEKIEISYTQLVESVLNIVEVSIQNKNIKIIKELNAEDKIKTYPNEVKQVILNLLKNAEDILLEKNVKNPYIKISTCKKDDKCILRVSDNAGGVPEDIIDNIFDPYFSTKLNKNGTGLGLYMSRIIIEEHCAGKLSVANDEFGAVFTVILEKDLKNDRY